MDDFDGRYPGAGSLVTWYTQTCQKIVQKRLVEKPSFKTVWSDEIENVLLLLLFLPCSSPKTVFSVAVQKLIVFCRVIFYWHFFKTELEKKNQTKNKYEILFQFFRYQHRRWMRSRMETILLILLHKATRKKTSRSSILLRKNIY